MDETAEVLILTAQVTAAWLRHHPIQGADVPGLILDVRKALTDRGGVTVPRALDPPSEPAVDPKRSVFPGHLVCLECGGRFATLKRHLRESHGTEPDQYRTRWSLPPTYPLIAPDYSERRSVLSARLRGKHRKARAANGRAAHG